MTVDLNEVTIGEEIGVLEYSIGTKEIEDYLAFLDVADPCYFINSKGDTPTVPPCYLCDDYLRLLFQGGYAASGLHIKAEYEFKGSIQYDQKMRVRGFVADIYISRGRKYIVIETIVTDVNGTELLVGRNTFLKAEQRD